MIRNNGLGRTSGGGPVNAAAAVANFMGTGAAAKKVRRGRITKKSVKKPRQLLNRLGGLLGGAGGGAGRGAAGGTAVGTPTPPGTVEEGVASSAGEGASTGLPTVGADGVISMTMHQVSLAESERRDSRITSHPTPHDSCVSDFVLETILLTQTFI